eukprot:1109529-Ditylum_brightwellii.AAC.1
MQTEQENQEKGDLILLLHYSLMVLPHTGTFPNKVNQLVPLQVQKYLFFIKESSKSVTSATSALPLDMA